MFQIRSDRASLLLHGVFLVLGAGSAVMSVRREACRVASNTAKPLKTQTERCGESLRVVYMSTRCCELASVITSFSFEKALGPKSRATRRR